jgi:hypothetical protein
MSTGLTPAPRVWTAVDQFTSTLQRALIFVLALLSLHLYDSGGHIFPAPVPAPSPQPGPSPVPNPSPPPAPTPIPTPKPVVGTLHVTLVYDLASLTPDLAALRASPTIGPAITGLGGEWRNFPATDPLLASRNLLPYTADVGLPCVLVQDDSKPAKVIHKFKATTEAALLAAVKSIRDGN